MQRGSGPMRVVSIVRTVRTHRLRRLVSRMMCGKNWLIEIERTESGKIIRPLKRRENDGEIGVMRDMIAIQSAAGDRREVKVLATALGLHGSTLKVGVFVIILCDIFWHEH